MRNAGRVDLPIFVGEKKGKKKKKEREKYDSRNVTRHFPYSRINFFACFVVGRITIDPRVVVVLDDK